MLALSPIKIVVSLGLAIGLCACPKPAVEPVTLKVLSYNLRHDVDGRR